MYCFADGGIFGTGGFARFGDGVVWLSCADAHFGCGGGYGCGDVAYGVSRYVV